MKYRKKTFFPLQKACPNYTLLKNLSLLSLSRKIEILFVLTTFSPGFEPFGDEEPEPFTGIDNEALIALCNSLKKHSNSLREFDLTVAAVGMVAKPVASITIEGVSSIVELLANCGQLEQLHLFCLK